MKNQSRNLWSLLCCSLAALGLAGCSGSNVDQLASQGPDGPGVLEIEIQNCGDRAHGDYWFERVPEITVEPLLCSNGSQGTAEHFVEKEYTCAQGVIAETGETRASLEFRNASCEPNSMPGACQPGTTRSCSIANGTGQQVCRIDGTGYDSCVAQSCNDNFRVVNNSCQRYIFTGISPFTCEEQFCKIRCSGYNQEYTINRGKKVFCTNIELSSSAAGSRARLNNQDGLAAWIAASYELNHPLVEAQTAEVKYKITCDVNYGRLTSTTRAMLFGSSQCLYEATGVSSTAVRRPIWASGASTGVSQSAEALNLNAIRFYPFRQVTKNTNMITRIYDNNTESYRFVPLPTVWRTSHSTGTAMSPDTVVEITLRPNRVWTYTKN